MVATMANAIAGGSPVSQSATMGRHCTQVETRLALMLNRQRGLACSGLRAAAIA